MAESTKSETPNTVHITDVGPSRKKISIEVPASTVSEHLGSSIDTLLGEAELPGFRRGRVPRRLVEKKFGPSIRKEAKNQIVATAYTKAIEDHKLRVIGDPTSPELDAVELREGHGLKFDVEIEVLPTFDLPKLEGIAVKKPSIVVTDEMVNTEIERLQLNEGSLKEKANPGKGDYLTGHAVMKDSAGKTILDIQDAVIQIPPADKEGKGMILGVMVDDFEKQLGTPKVGHPITITTVGPENHENEQLRGVKLTISYAPKIAQEIIRSPLEEVARRYGMETGDEVRAAVRARIEQKIEVEKQSAMRQQIARHLIESTTMELPERVTAQQAARNLERQRMELLYRGVDPQQIEEHMAEIRATTSEVAVRELKLFFAIDKAAEELDVKVSDGEINGRIAQMAVSRGERPEKLRQELISKNQVGMVFAQVREHKTLDAILAKAKIEDVSVDDYNKSMQAASDEIKSKTGAKAKAEDSDKGEGKAKAPKAKK